MPEPPAAFFVVERRGVAFLIVPAAACVFFLGGVAAVARFSFVVAIRPPYDPVKQPSNRIQLRPQQRSAEALLAPRLPKSRAHAPPFSSTTWAATAERLRRRSCWGHSPVKQHESRSGQGGCLKKRAGVSLTDSRPLSLSPSVREISPTRLAP